MSNGTTVTLLIFSGRPDPHWELSEEQVKELRDRLGRVDAMTAQAPPGILHGLGYRGFEVRWHPDTAPVHIHGGVVGTPGIGPNYIDADRATERFLLDTMPADAAGVRPLSIDGAPLRAALRQHVEEDFRLRPDQFEREITTKAGACPPCGGALAPAYNPGMWNVPSVQPYNNC